MFHWHCSSCMFCLFAYFLVTLCLSSSWWWYCLFYPAGGITTLIDMPLNSDPSTVSPETLKLKVTKPLKFFFLLILLCIHASLLCLEQCLVFNRLKLRKREHMLMLVNTICYQHLPHLLITGKKELLNLFLCVSGRFGAW